ncbi:MAG: PadR family transcriptional regulator [Anaerolineales bacterium]
MSLEHAILGFLSYEPLTGYDLKKFFDRSVAHFWAADQSQIYRTLTRMEQNGWVQVEVVPQEPRPPRKVYSITATGQAELQSWLLTAQSSEPTRLAWLIQVFFAGQVDNAQAAQILRNQADALRARLQRYARIPNEDMQSIQPDEDPRQVFFWTLTVEYGIVQLQSQLAWIEQALARLERADYQPRVGELLQDFFSKETSVRDKRPEG